MKSQENKFTFLFTFIISTFPLS